MSGLILPLHKELTMPATYVPGIEDPVDERIAWHLSHFFLLADATPCRLDDPGSRDFQEAVMHLGRAYHLLHGSGRQLEAKVREVVGQSLQSYPQLQQAPGRPTLTSKGSGLLPARSSPLRPFPRQAVSLARGAAGQVQADLRSIPELDVAEGKPGALPGMAFLLESPSSAA
jgi:hypothetical protein